MQNLTSRRNKAAVLFLLTILAVSLFWAAPQLYPRAQLVTWKVTGQLPYLPWGDLLRTITPQRWRALVAFPSLPPAFDAMKNTHADGPCPVLWDTALGPFWGRDSDGLVLYSTINGIVFGRERESPTVAVQANDVVLDVGSHVGTFTRYALRRGARLVVAFEPEPTNIACFKKNFHDELDQGRVILVDAAAWEKSGVLQFSSGDDGLSWSFSAVPVLQLKNASTFAVTATTLDDTVEQLKLNRVDFIKMNIEGSERHALQGARRTLMRFEPRMDISIHHLQDDVKTIPQLVHEIRPGYTISFNVRLSEVFFHPRSLNQKALGTP